MSLSDRSVTGDAPVLLGREGLPFVVEHFEGADDLGPGVGGIDHIVDEASTGRDVGVHEEALVLFDELGTLGLRVVVTSDLVAVDDVDRALGAHDGDLSRRPA